MSDKLTFEEIKETAAALAVPRGMVQVPLKTGVALGDYIIIADTIGIIVGTVSVTSGVQQGTAYEKFYLNQILLSRLDYRQGDGLRTGQSEYHPFLSSDAVIWAEK